MSRFPTAGDLASWAGMCPGNNQSVTAIHGSRGVLGQVAVAAARTKGTYLAARYRRSASRRGRKHALVAVGHTVLIAMWAMLCRDVAYHDLGGDYFTGRLNPRARSDTAVGC